MRDPDGYMIEVGQSTGLLEGKLATKRPEDLPGLGVAETSPRLPSAAGSTKPPEGWQSG
jgi:hypothetical protein